jgi:hypothetical protein
MSLKATTRNSSTVMFWASMRFENLSGTSHESMKPT